MNAESRYARRLVFYAFLLLAAVYLHFFFLARAGNSGGWSRWVPGEEAMTVFFVSFKLFHERAEQNALK